jgi:Scaffold protein Nfu/NifU N terminal
MNGVLVEEFSCEYIRDYHVRQPLIEAGKMSMESTEEEDKDPSGITNIIITIPGVERVTVYRYRMSIKRARMYSWTEVESELFKFLESFQAE